MAAHSDPTEGISLEELVVATKQRITALLSRGMPVDALWVVASPQGIAIPQSPDGGLIPQSPDTVIKILQSCRADGYVIVLPSIFVSEATFRRWGSYERVPLEDRSDSVVLLCVPQGGPIWAEAAALSDAPNLQFSAVRPQDVLDVNEINSSTLPARW